jgi:ribosomal protein S18 acetylase RimI-like enzyme
MQHPLNNPSWHALVSGNKNLAFGNEKVKYFDVQVSPFVGLEENSADNFKILGNILANNKPIGFISDIELEIPEGWKLFRYVKCLQMVYISVQRFDLEDINLIPLTDLHIPQMLELTKLTKPWPFDERTINFGDYFGIFEDDKLVAMGGQRLHPKPYQEISAICTHPNYLGKGYASQILKFHINRILNEEGIPFLHVRHDNHRAIQVYERLGFDTRTYLHFYFIQKEEMV